MPEGARVDSVDTLTLFRAALFKFQEAAQVALSDAEGEMQRVLMWVENEQQTYWQNQIRKRQEIVNRAKEAVRMKKLYKDSSGRQQSAVDEEKALQIAIQKLAEAEGKLVAVKRWSRQLQKEIQLYKGGVQRFATTVQSEIPHAAAHLEGLARKLDAYLSVQAGSTGTGDAASAASAGASMARGHTSAVMSSVQDSIPPVPQEQRSALAATGLVDGGSFDGLYVFIDESAPAQPELKLRRDETGWYVGNAEIPNARRVAANDLLAKRPDLAELCSLPVGFSVTMDNSGIVEVLDPKLQVVWTRGG